MANFCAKCGAAMVPGAKFCPECGAPAAEPTGQRPVGAPPPPPGAAPPPPPVAAAAGGMQPNVARCLCYVLTWLTGIIFLNIEPQKHDPEVKFHAWQAIFFGIAISVVWIALWILTAILLSAGLWSIVWLFSAVRLIFGLGVLAIWILLMVKAYNGGTRFKLPVIGDLAEQQASK